jgi:Fe2+ transport system protein FeoA
MLRRALGGDPLEIDVMGYALSLRRAEARKIIIELTQD